MKIKNLLAGFSLTTGLLAGLYFLHAQDATFTQTGAASLSDTNINWNSLSDFEVELKLIEATPTISATDLASQGLEGTFYSAQHINDWPPLPGDPLMLPLWQVDTNLFLIDDLHYNYAAASANTPLATGSTLAMDSMDGGFSPLVSYPAGSLWLQINGITNGTVYLTLNGTTNGVEYQILSQEALSNAPLSSWNAEGPLFWGSDTTNWTTTTVAQNGRTNLFLAAQSWADSTGSGVPDWWLLKYFGTTSVDVNALDSANDGWTVWQKFLMGAVPGAWVTPPAPPNLAVSFNASSSTANVSWDSSLGPVTGYTVQKYDEWTAQTTTFNFSQSVNNFPDTITDNQGEKINPFEGDFGPAIFIQYQIQAHYSGGDSAWSDPVLLEPNGQSSASDPVNLPVDVIEGPGGSAYLAAWGLPAGTVTLRVKRADEYANMNYGDGSYDTTVDISVSTATNGLYLLPATITAGPLDGYGQSQYDWFVQTVDTNDNPSQPMQLTYMNSAPGNGTSWLVPSYFDGRAQLKQNLIFQLRAANEAGPFQFTEVATNFSTTSFSYPASYAYAGLYPFDDNSVGDFDSLLPFERNYLYRNFMLSLSPNQDVDNTGTLTTGAGQDSDLGLALLDPPTYQFQTPAPGVTNIPPLLATNVTQWLLAEPYNNPGAVGITITGSPATYQVAANAQNIFGLQYQSTELAYQTSGGLGTTTLSAGGGATPSATSSVNIYSGAAQPQFQTVEYDFWQKSLWGLSPLPGSASFSITNQSDLLITAVGDPNFQVNGYAKLALLNGYSGVYAYLGQYFNQAWQIGANGNVTTNATGLLSPFGGFFATQPGPVALVTMPDPDTGQRGTCTVYCVSLNVDANHDGVMDTSFSGPDNTSSAKPMEFWVNDGYDDQNGVDHPSYEGNTNYADAQINWQRDLENFGRLWICGVPKLPSSQGYTVTLRWLFPPNGSPAINLFRSVETNGGIGYLTDTNVAAAQTDLEIGGPGEIFGQVPSSGTFTFPPDFFDGTNKYFLFEGAGIGSGELVLEIYQNGHTIARSGVWLDLHDIEDFYERAAISDNMNGAISNWTSTIESLQPAVANLCGNDTNLIVFVHGINVNNWAWRDESDTVLKRLYWSGYQGKFMTVDWPCNFFNIWTLLGANTTVFNDSEVKAYKASTSLKNYLNQLRSRFPNYQLNILAHSQGNPVVSEAIEQGAPFDTYILTQGALPDSCYDADAPTYDGLVADENTYGPTPEWAPMGYRGVYTNFTGRIVNFYNTNDPVLAVWQSDQGAAKPNTPATPYTYDGTDGWYDKGFSWGYMVTDPEESRAEVSRSRTLAIGQSPPESAHGVIRSGIDLTAHFNFGNAFPADHSAQWTRPIQTTRPYFQQVLTSCGIQPAP